MKRKTKCSGCNGSGWIPYEQRDSVNWWVTRASKRPCQECNLKAFGLPESEAS